VPLTATEFLKAFQASLAPAANAVVFFGSRWEHFVFDDAGFSLAQVTLSLLTVDSTTPGSINEGYDTYPTAVGPKDLDSCTCIRCCAGQLGKGGGS
jgi:hypothetical protein